MSAGIAQENGALQNITLAINAAETFVVPPGLLHYNHNQECVPNVFFQSFSNSDPGALNVIGALAAFNAEGGDGPAAMLASGAASIVATPQGAFTLDGACLKRCGFPAEGAPGGGLQELPAVLKALAGLVDAPPPSTEARAADRCHGQPCARALRMRRPPVAMTASGTVSTMAHRERGMGRCSHVWGRVSKRGKKGCENASS
jgi:hypothetical protein